MPDPDFENQVEKIETDGDETPEPEAKEIHPFMRVSRGEDTLNRGDRVIFADFSMKPIPSDAEEEEDGPELAPKAGSAQPPVGLEDLTPSDVQTQSEKSAQTPASSDDGPPSQSANTSQASS